MVALLEKERECLIFPKVNALQTRAQKQVAEQEKETAQLRNTFSKGTKTKEGKFGITKVLSRCLSTPRDSDMTARENKPVNQLKIINEKKRLQHSKFTEVLSPATSTCLFINDTKMKVVTKISKRSTYKKETGKISIGKLLLHLDEMVKI
ncbi:hypothetical protein AVEN_73849-1 [Araneus ventricosus]|uniref:Uncharacterized protein n=1 Tax=Araneus ventricosus TaxID=182803 RepID=A0A4Y2GFB6_ARAVE|nr:hypothetical protein AVEN_73849-1 [Araneus ventricosus]